MLVKRSILLLCSTFVFVSCGGGGSGSVGTTPGSGSSTPTPSPSPSPSPSPTPTPSAGATGEMKPSGSTASFDTTQSMTVVGSTKTLSGGSTNTRSVTGLNGAFSILYDTSTSTYTLRNEERTQLFGPSVFSTETNLPDYFPRVEFHTATSVSDDYLVFFKQANASPSIPTNFSAYGAWQHNDIQAAGTRVRLDYFVYGTPTPVAAMPHTGTATYRVSGTGNYADDSRLFFTQSYLTVTVNFATGGVTTHITLTGTDFLSNNFGGLLGANFAGQVSGNTADGPLTFSQDTWAGNAHIFFFGPNAENIGIAYSASSPIIGTFNGAAVGVNP